MKKLFQGVVFFTKRHTFSITPKDMSFSIILVCRNSVENNIKLFFLFSSAREKLTKLYSVNYHLM